MKLQLKELRQLQSQLDQRIFDLHSTQRSATTRKRILALLVELGELANETRCFKFWSLKGSSAREVIAQEFSDGLHFFLSLGIDLDDQSEQLEATTSSQELSEQFLVVYSKVDGLSQQFTLDGYHEAFAQFLGLATLLGMRGEEIYEHYILKNQTNHQRQDHQY